MEKIDANSVILPPRSPGSGCFALVSPSIRELASSPTIGHDLCVVHMQILIG